ncbi:thioredoxin fold domain-containing protein [Marinilongibacter aquaticus]|nr:thioredoxin fold domain-containing protein [Marinilongibacter aquaticus]
MRKSSFVFLFVLGLAQVSLAQGIDFEHGNWSQILAKAKAENKLIFMDAYTTWCGPCKLLQKKVFPQKEVGDYFNAHFISTKVDMEKGEGPTLARKYRVSGYPTLFFIDPNSQKIVKSVLGYRDAQALLDIAKKANAKIGK